MDIKSISPEVVKAYEFFKELHKDQKRKDGVRSYFDAHLVPVAELVWEYSGSETLVVVALGHDSSEDQNLSNYIIFHNFGFSASTLIWYLTDVYTKENFPSLNRSERKEAERKRYSYIPYDAKLVKLCDIVTNLRDDNDDVGFMTMYVREKIACLPYLKIENPIYQLAVDTVKEKDTKYGIAVDSL